MPIKISDSDRSWSYRQSKDRIIYPSIIATEYEDSYEPLPPPPPGFYRIIWYNYDGTVLDITDVPEGDLPVYEGETPTRPGTPHKIYVFSHWDPEVVEATESTSYIAVFMEITQFEDLNPDDPNILINNESQVIVNPNFSKTQGYSDILLRESGSLNNYSSTFNQTKDKVFIEEDVSINLDQVVLPESYSDILYQHEAEVVKTNISDLIESDSAIIMETSPEGFSTGIDIKVESLDDILGESSLELYNSPSEIVGDSTQDSTVVSDAELYVESETSPMIHEGVYLINDDPSHTYDTYTGQFNLKFEFTITSSQVTYTSNSFYYSSTRLRGYNSSSGLVDLAQRSNTSEPFTLYTDRIIVLESQPVSSVEYSIFQQYFTQTEVITPGVYAFNYSAEYDLTFRLLELQFSIVMDDGSITSFTGMYASNLSLVLKCSNPTYTFAEYWRDAEVPYWIVSSVDSCITVTTPLSVSQDLYNKFLNFFTPTEVVSLSPGTYYFKTSSFYNSALSLPNLSFSRIYGGVEEQYTGLNVGVFLAPVISSIDPDQELSYRESMTEGVWSDISDDNLIEVLQPISLYQSQYNAFFNYFEPIN